MGYEMKVIQNFSRFDPQKLKFGLFAGCFMVSLTYLSMSKPYSIPVVTVNSRSSSTHAAPTTDPLLKDIASTHAAPTTDPLLKDVASSRELDCRNGARENMTQESKLRCNVSNPQSDLREKVDVTMMPMNSSTYESPPHRGQDANNAQQLESSNKTEKSPISNDPNSVRDGITNMTRALKNSSATAIESIKRLDSKQLDDRNGDLKPQRKPMCDVSNKRSDVCEMEGDIRITGKFSSVILVTSSEMGDSERNESWRIKPYPRKTDSTAMASVREVSLKSLDGNEESPRCTVNHSIPAIVFSDTGYTGNYFHAFTDVLLPLFLTSREFNGEVQFLVTDLRLWWIHKYLPIFKMLSRYEMIDFDNDDRVHCFRHAIVGLKCHDDLSINPSRPPKGHSMVEFTEFMRNTYSLSRDSPMRMGEIPGRKPRLLIVARSRTRRFTNIDKIVRMASKLGYEVVVAENDGKSNVAEFAQLVNSCDVMMGVHGAGLTNLVFLPTNAILIQIIPWGKLEWIAGYYFREPAKTMKLRYLEYSISEDESTLKDLYPRDHPVLKDPMSIHKGGWNSIREVYLVKQNVKLNVKRFRGVLSKALKLLHQ